MRGQTMCSGKILSRSPPKNIGCVFGDNETMKDGRRNREGGVEICENIWR